MNALFQTDVNNMLIMPTFVLCHANQSPIDTINYVENFHFNEPENNPCEISFSVRRMINGEVNAMYASLEDFKLVYIPEWSKYYQIQVSEKDFEEGLIKDVIGKHLCEAELSQLMLYDIEINTENDILRDDYSHTLIYDPENPKQSLLHRILNDKGRNYTIGYVSPSLQRLTRSFSIDGQSIDDFLRTTLAEELNCIVKYDSTDRSISLYDTLKICPKDIKHRGDYTGDTCPICGASGVYTEYGEDTGILISTKNLAEEITVETDISSVKTCFRVTGGDDKITTYVRAVNPNGSQYIYNFSNEMLADMPDELRERIESYTELYEQRQPGYKELNQLIFENIDEQEYYRTSMMPTSEVNTTANDELNKLKSSELGDIGITSLSDLTAKTTVDNAVLGVARLEMAKGYNVEIVESTFTYVSETASTWSGKFKVSHYSDTEDTATNDSNISLTVTNDYETFVLQKMDRELAKADAPDIDTDWSLYSYDYLYSYYSAYQSCLDTLTQLGVNDDDEHGKLCSELYSKYWAEWKEIEAEMAVREAKISELEAAQIEYEKIRNEINKELDFEAYLGEELFKEFFHYRRDDEYNNANYTSEGLTDADALRKAEELVEAASVQLYKASQTQYTISGTVANFLLMEEFKHLRDECELGNWIYIQTDDGDVYKLRLNGISGDYSSIDHLELTFSNAHNLTNPIYSLRDTILKANSMASSYSSVMHQASQGNVASQTLNDMRRLGLVAARYRIVNADNQTITIDEHGLLGREWDDLEGTYSPEQVKLVNNLMCYTDDGWKTVKQAIGKITYKDPATKQTVNKYGVIADTIIAADIYGSKFVGGDIYSENYWDIDEENGEKLGDKGTHINLNDGTFTIAGGLFSFDGNKLTLSSNTIVDGDTTLSSKFSQTESEILSEVSETYATQDTTNKLSTRISQTARSITMKATGNTNDSTESVGIEIQLYDENGNKIETVDEDGNPTGSANITLTGLVKFASLNSKNPDDATFIDGGNIHTGTLYVGKQVVMGADATISWEQVTEKPDDLASVDDIPDEDEITQITQTSINTGKITLPGIIIAGEDTLEGYDLSTIVVQELDCNSLYVDGGMISLKGHVELGEDTWLTNYKLTDEIAYLHERIDDIETSSGNCSCDVSSLESRVSDLEDAGYITSSYVSSQLTNYVKQTDFNALEDSLDDYVKTTTLNTTLQDYALSSTVSSMSSTVDMLSDKMQTMEQNTIPALDTRVTTLENNNASYASASALNDLSETVDFLSNNVQDIDTVDIPNLESRIATLEEQVLAIKQTLDENGMQTW